MDKEMVYVEEGYCPQAVLDYAKDEQGNCKSRSELISRVKKHFASVGWTFYYQKNGERRDLRYETPHGRVFYTLISACKWYVGKGCIQINEYSASPVPLPDDDEFQFQGCTKEAKMKEFALRFKVQGSVLLLDSTRKRKADQVSEPITKRPKLQCQKSEKTVESDSICSVCRYEGDLILCDHCPSAYHTECVGVEHLPEGEWFCPSCCCRICSQVASTKNSYLHCSQCEHRYHFKCLTSTNPVHDEAQGIWFCSSTCESIHSSLQNLLGKPIPVGDDGLEWCLLKYKHSTVSDKASSSKLNAALRIMHECFKPCKEANGRDIVKDAIFNESSDLHRLNFPGFYTVGLGRKGKFFIAALIRIYGQKVAEIPFVGTRFKYQKLGMCRLLMNELEKKLVELGVERLVLPASKYIVKTWENKFGFSRMNGSEKLNFLGCTFLDFKGTAMCQKILKKASSPDFRQDEHIYDHIDDNTMSEVFQEYQESGT